MKSARKFFPFVLAILLASTLASCGRIGFELLELEDTDSDTERDADTVDTLDGDSDGVPDVSDPCPLDNPDDSDGDGVCDGSDICPGGDDSLDGDGDGLPDACDPCPATDDPVCNLGIQAVTCQDWSGPFGNGCQTTMDNDVTTYDRLDCGTGTGSSGGIVCTAVPGELINAWYQYDLGVPETVGEIRFSADWWSKRPKDWQLWTSDVPGWPEPSATLAASGVGHAPAYSCNTGESCAPREVPVACCPDGRANPQDTRNVGKYIGKWEYYPVAPHTARYWTFVIVNSRDGDDLIMAEIDLIASP